VPTSSKPASKPASKLASKPASKPKATPRLKRSAKASAPSRKPFLRFYHSESLRAKTLAVLATLEKAKDPREHRDALADIVVELTDAGMEYYFLPPQWGHRLTHPCSRLAFTRATTQPKRPASVEPLAIQTVWWLDQTVRRGRAAPSR
jgi:hypothetical protein